MNERERQEARSARWVAIALTAMLLVAPAVAGVVWAVLPAFRRRGEPARAAVCKSFLRQIGLACHMWADEHDDEMPEALEQLLPRYVDNGKIFTCPEARHRGLPLPHYYLVRGLRADMPSEKILAYEHPPNHGGEHFCVLFLDAHVECWPISRRAEFEDRLARQIIELEELRLEREQNPTAQDAASVNGER
ncbi:MAG: hypothetical protein ACYTGB_03420 [Planctomycetota bacterium]|jgi:hypothetical protein